MKNDESKGEGTQGDYNERKNFIEVVTNPNNQIRCEVNICVQESII